MKLPCRFLRIVAATALLVGTTHDAHAQSAPVHALARAPNGTVLAIDREDLVIDLGKEKGAHDGQIVELWRPMRVRHPVTGQILTDRFRIGSVRLAQVQQSLALGKVDGTALRQPTAGDLVLVAEDDLPHPPPPITREPASPSTVEAKTAPADSANTTTTAPSPSAASTADPDVRALGDLFVALQGANPQERADTYAAFVRTRPNSRFTKTLREEIEALRVTAKRDERPSFDSSFVPLGRMRPAQAQPFAVELDPRFVGAIMHVRTAGQPGYTSISMQALGARYWGATLPKEMIAEPGIEYFVEGVQDGGAAVEIIGRAAEPKHAEVESVVGPAKKAGSLAQINAWSEYASFNVKRANDYVFQTEGNFGWRLHDEGVRAVRSGFGVLRGKGGSLVELDNPETSSGRDVGLTYGYLELELGIGRSFGLIGRPILGLREGGISGGAQGFFRVGSDLATNLLFGGEVLGTVGLRGIVQLDWRTIPRVPIMLRSEVTNQPAGSGGDIGARAIAQVGYELVRDLTVSVRGSYQGRTINHAGPGAGAGVSYQW